MSWKLIKLGTLIEVLSGFAFDSKKFSDSYGMPLIRIRDIKRSYTETYYNGNFEEKYVVKSGDVLIGMDGEFNVAEWNGIDALLNQRVCKVTVKEPNHLDLRYLLYFLPYELKLIEDKASFVTVKHLSVNDVKNIQIPLPPLATQKRIAEILDAADALRRKDQELLKKYDELAQAIFIDMFGDPVKNEMRWEKMNLGSVCNFSQGTQVDLSEQKNVKSPGWNRFLRISDYTTDCEERFVQVFDKKYWVEDSDIVIVRYGASAGFVGIGKQGILANNLFKLNHNKNILNHFFLLHQLKQNFYIDFIQKVAFGAAMPALSFGVMNDLEIICPPIKLQLDFENRISQLNKIQNNKNRNVLNSNSLFDSLIQKAFKGELIA